MNPNIDRPLIAAMRHELTTLQKNWFWFVLLGVALLIPGVIALLSPWVASVATAFVIGFLLVAGGAVDCIGAIICRGWSCFFLFLLSGILSIVVGLLFLKAPVEALLAITLLLACLLMVTGVFKIVSAVMHRPTAWGWELLGGLIDFALGVMIWQGLPESALWVVGLFVGISLIFRGAHWIGIGLKIRSLPSPQPA